ncbi:MAG TPA: hypothetical protein VIK26_00030 [Clostridium sp.]
MQFIFVHEYEKYLCEDLSSEKIRNMMKKQSNIECKRKKWLKMVFTIYLQRYIVDIAF